jgi:hypothetical protein
MAKPDFEGNSKNNKKKFEESQDYLAEQLHQEPDHPSILMNMTKKEHIQCLLPTMKDVKFYLHESFGMDL